MMTPTTLPTGALPDLVAESQVVGRRYHLPRFHLSPEVAARFAAVVGADPERLRPAAHPCIVARPALGVLNALLADPALGAERATMLHAHSDIRWVRPLQPGTDVALDAEIVDVGAYGNRRGLVVATRVAEPEGPVLVELQTVLAFAPPALPAAEGRPPLQVPSQSRHDNLALASREVRLDDEFPARYAAVSGDANPIHLDPVAARAAGLPGVVLHGLSTVAVGASFVIDELAGGDSTALARMRVRFARPARPGGMARYRAFRTTRPDLFALSCHVGGVAIWRHAAVEMRL